MKKKNIKYIVLMAISLLFVGINSCDLDQLEDPNSLTAEQVEVDYLLNQVQLFYQNVTAGDKFENEPGLNTAGMEIIRMKAMFGAYTGTFTDLTATSVDRLWRYAYEEVFNNGKAVLDILEGTEGYDHHLGITKTVMAMTLVNLVDHFGDIPWTEALQGADNFNPAVDDDAALYNVAFTYLDEAIVHFGETPQAYPSDFFYNGSGSNWINFINSFKMKMYLNLRLTDASAATTAINAILSSGNYIQSTAGDMQWQYSSSATNPDSRHPDFKANYSAGGSSDYMSNWYMNAMYNEKTDIDPRMRYYFYRQTPDAPSGDNLPCDGLGFDYCYIGGLYWGRDHSDDEGVPPDGELRTTFGVYPAGGELDTTQFATVTSDAGLGGAGIFPIMLYSYVDFMLAEAVLELGVASGMTARAHFEQGIRTSMAKVRDFGAAHPAATDTVHLITDYKIDNYVTEALANYDAASNPLDIVIKEYFLALFGNGMEAYNAYKRTGYPSDIQAPVRESGAFPRTFQYPANAVQLNKNISQRIVTERVFWDDGSTTLN